MTLYLARKIGPDYAVDETSTVYIGRCDDDDCQYMADHPRVEVVDDALNGHRRRAHPGVVTNSPGLLSFTASSPLHHGTVKPNPHVPSPTPRGQEAP